VEPIERRIQKNRSQQKRYYSADGRPRQMFSSARKRAVKKGLEFSLNIQWLRDKFDEQDQKCAMTGIQFVYTKDDRFTRQAFSPSLDRIDNDKGYTPENTRLVCTMYNYCRNVARDEDVEYFAWQLFQHKFGVRPK